MTDFPTEPVACVPLLPLSPELIPFDVLIYGRTAKQLMTIPNEVIHSLAKKYPSYTSSMFFVHDIAPVRRS